MVKQLQLNPVTSVLEEIVGPLWTTVHCCVGRALRNSKHGCCPQRCEYTSSAAVHSSLCSLGYHLQV